MSKDILNKSLRNKTELIDQFDDDFLTSKDLALKPINSLFENVLILHIDENKNRNLSLKVKKESQKEIKTFMTKNSEKSQKSTSNTNKKYKKKKSFSESQLYSSNIIIVNYIDEDEENCSSSDPIEKEILKFNRLMSKLKEMKRKKKKTNKSNV